MSNIILQHWDSEELPEWAVAASNTMRDYAAKCGAEYRLLHGKPFFDMLFTRSSDGPPWLHVNVQKLVFLSEEFDEYDQVCMYDMDMCATPWAKNVFNEPGNLNIWHVAGYDLSQGYRYPWMLTGGVYKFNREQRIALRGVLLKLELNKQETLSGAVPTGLKPPWYDEHVFAVLIHHPDGLLDPASLKQIDVEFDYVFDGRVGWGRELGRPIRDEDVSVRHFSEFRKHLIVPEVRKWHGIKKGVRLNNLVHRWRYFRHWLPKYLNVKLVLLVKDQIRECLVASSRLSLEL